MHFASMQKRMDWRKELFKRSAASAPFSLPFFKMQSRIMLKDLYKADSIYLFVQGAPREFLFQLHGPAQEP